MFLSLSILSSNESHGFPGLDKLEYLQTHANQDIYRKSYNIIDKYFSHEEASEDMQLAPQHTSEQFVFNVPGPAGDAADPKTHWEF